jgi:regulator of RNase E activity RraA
VEVFGTSIVPGQLIHADKHGFLAIPPGEEKGLLEAARFMDENECNTFIPAARSAAGKPSEQVLAELNDATQKFKEAIAAFHARRGTDVSNKGISVF